MKKLLMTSFLLSIFASNTFASVDAKVSCAQQLSQSSLVASKETSTTNLVASQTQQSVSNTITVNGYTLIPIQDLCKAAGATYVWDNKTAMITIKKDHLDLILKIGDHFVKSSDGIIDDYLKVPPKIHNKKIMVPLREVAENLGCIVTADPKNKTLSIKPSGEILVPKLPDTNQDEVANWANVSSGQQFLYKNEGLAYAYAYDDNLIIQTPNSKLSIKMQYPLLGDVISDEDGNFYIVWGRTGQSSSEETMFISKYSSNGEQLSTTGFKGESVMNADGNTKIPFDAGNCTSAIGNGRLMVNYAREMYNGHQSNGVIGVNLSDMSPVTFSSIWDIPYASHSFNQSIIWSKNVNQFIYANHGDAYDRGFVVASNLGNQLLFHFYLEPNANYDMYIVNKTFAQLGNLAETRKGIALVGASAKSIGEAAKNEKQNLFIQIFNPSEKNSASSYIGGTERQGETSMDINDNSNTSLTKVTDYGVNWLTQYTKTDVIAPQVVAADNRLVILWTTEKDSFYMLLSEDGTIIKPATSLKGLPLNSYERPLFYDNAVYWVGVKEGKLKVYSLKI